MPAKPVVFGNEAWKALSNKEPEGKPDKVRLRLTPLDIYGRIGREGAKDTWPKKGEKA